jgi:MFS family permease
VGETWAAGVALAVGAATTALTLQYSGRLADSIGRRRPIIIGLALSAVSMGTMGLAGGLVMILVLTAALGVGSGLLNPAQQATVADVVGNGRSGGKVLAAFQMCQDAGGIGGPVLVGFVADQAGWEWAFALSGLISALAIIPWLRSRETLVVHAG